MPIGKIVIENVRPSTPAGYPAKAISGKSLLVTADAFKEGHDAIAVRVRFKMAGSRSWQSSALSPVGNDSWEGHIVLEPLGLHEFVVEAWTDHFGTWATELAKKHDAGMDLSVELEEGTLLLERHPPVRAGMRAPQISRALSILGDPKIDAGQKVQAALDPDLAAAISRKPLQTDLTRSRVMQVWVDRPRALVGAWYEMFPRSEGGFDGASRRLTAIKEMGFDVVYLPPVHPIGKTLRKGKNNSLDPAPDDPGSPWAIGSESGGHTAVDANLGTIDDFDRFIKEAENVGLEVCLDYALQCSPDHPWASEHPEWFHHRPDGTIKYAENPPKKYQDIYPLNFWPETGHEPMWTACKQILDHWIAHGIKMFRVDNPHTKPFAFWEWLIGQVRSENPDVIFLSEAFTRPKVMAKLAEIGFTQSYTYFTWRRTSWELRDYLTELALGPKANYMRPNFWPNTPDILSEPLRRGGQGAFKQRLVLAATMSPSYGIYSGYELIENEPASDYNEEYLHSEKYEIKRRDWDQPGSLAPFITRVNEIRRRHPCFSHLDNIRFHHSTNDQIIAYSKDDGETSDVVLMVVNLDPHNTHESTLLLDMNVLGVTADEPFEAHDELTDTTYIWTGAGPYVRLSPEEPAHILHIRPRGQTRAARATGFIAGVH